MGIGETCNGTNYTFKDYRTVDMKDDSYNDYFQWTIYRVGAVPNLKASSLEQVHITYNAPSNIGESILGKYTWNENGIWGIQKGNASDAIK